MCGEMRKSGGCEQKTGGYEQCCSERTEQIRSHATDNIKKKELNDNPYIESARKVLQKPDFDNDIDMGTCYGLLRHAIELLVVNG